MNKIHFYVFNCRWVIGKPVQETRCLKVKWLNGSNFTWTCPKNSSGRMVPWAGSLAKIANASFPSPHHTPSSMTIHILHAVETSASLCSVWFWCLSFMFNIAMFKSYAPITPLCLRQPCCVPLQSYWEHAPGLLLIVHKRSCYCDMPMSRDILNTFLWLSYTGG